MRTEAVEGRGSYTVIKNPSILSVDQKFNQSIRSVRGLLVHNSLYIIGYLKSLIEYATAPDAKMVRDGEILAIGRALNFYQNQYWELRTDEGESFIPNTFAGDKIVKK